jgi:hypothetical protein
MMHNNDLQVSYGGPVRVNGRHERGFAFLEIVQHGNVVLVAQPFGDLRGEGGLLDSGHCGDFSDCISALYLDGKMEVYRRYESMSSCMIAAAHK